VSKNLITIGLVSLMLVMVGCAPLRSQLKIKAGDDGRPTLEEANFVGPGAHAALGLLEGAELCENNDGTFSRCDISTSANPTSSSVRISTGSSEFGIGGSYVPGGAAINYGPGAYVVGPSAATYTTSAAFGGQEVQVERVEMDNPREQVFQIRVHEDVEPAAADRAPTVPVTEDDAFLQLQGRVETIERSDGEQDVAIGGLRATDKQTTRTIRSLGEALEEE
jgi:hypothetical protein